MKIHILNNNIVRKKRLLSEHGLSLLIEFNGKLILLDTGQTDVYLRNAKSMELDITQVECIVLSHGHYDHCGGLEFFPFEARRAKVYVKESAFAKKLGRNSDGKTFRDIGIPWTIDGNVLDKDLFFFTKTNECIGAGIYLLSGIKNNSSTDKLSENILVEYDGIKRIDKMDDEQILVLKNEEGLHVFVGCSHPGIISIILHIKDLFPNEKIVTLLGGMHLEHVDEERLLNIIQKLDSFGIKRIIPLHCTGIKAIVRMNEYFADRCKIAYTGDMLEF